MANALEFRILENSGGWHPEKIMGLDFKVRSCSLSVRSKHQRDRLHILEASMNV